MSIKTLSPHYISIPLTSPLTGVICSSYEVRIYIWDGSKTAIPAEPSYTMTKINASGSSRSDRINIARIASDFIGFECIPQQGTVLVDGNNQVWIKYECYYNDSPTVPALQEVSLALKGYGYFLEGENPQLPSNKILLTGDEFKVSRDGRFVLPIMVDEPPVPIRTLTINNFVRSTGVNYTLTATANFPYTEIFVSARPVGSSSWTPVEHSGSSYIVPSGIASGLFEVRAGAFDPVTSAIIYSAVYNITAIRIYKVEPYSSGYATRIFYNLNINATTVDLQLYNNGSWQSWPYDANSPRYFSWTPTGNQKIRMMVNGNYSNEVSLTIPLAATINIP
ncbi:hypothetical protein HYN59_07205 [Flavobacterium album]|uniref:Uncharacterized protein n=1 Tax=Flavobacterium album TaxID=2175091 RepID=A0A2S1QWZ1_9FLAO|nr:hypothetical protein [Flavobacterium album]AWH84926.1 hypothetical protein HYN59_07205 [Flavobacterium album]